MCLSSIDRASILTDLIQHTFFYLLFMKLTLVIHITPLTLSIEICRAHVSKEHADMVQLPHSTDKN